jgi:prephenate dehydrogenase
MNTIQIGIVGGTRGMGNWFANFLEEEGYRVHVFGRNMGTEDIARMADICRVVVVSVPIRVTGAVIEKIGTYVRKDALLMDLTSLKEEPVQAMLKASVSEVVGCHPLFGPHVGAIAGQRVVLCPARGDHWLPWLKGILEKSGASVVETTPEIHDRMMAIIQGLNHFDTIMIGLALSRTGVSFSELCRFATPAFAAKVEIIRKVFCQNPILYADIVSINPNIHEFIETYEQGMAELKELIYQGNASDIADMIEKCASFFKGSMP